MNISLIIFIFSIVVYIPVAAVLLYVWHKYGKSEKAVSYARATFFIGSAFIIIFMMAL